MVLPEESQEVKSLLRFFYQPCSVAAPRQVFIDLDAQEADGRDPLHEMPLAFGWNAI